MATSTASTADSIEGSMLFLVESGKNIDPTLPVELAEPPLHR